MSVKKSHYLILLAAFGIIGAGAVFFPFPHGKKELQLIPRPRAVIESATASGTEVGTGCSVKED